MLPSIEQRLALELAAKPVQVAAAIALLDEGATVPFIARYRKEATGGLDDIQLRLLEERLRYLRELEDRRAAIIASITEQNKMTPELLDAVTHAEDKTRLEDLYLPYKQKRRTKAQIADRSRPGAAGRRACWPTRRSNPEEEAAKYLRDAFTTDDGDNPGVADTKAALDGARQILMERFAEDATLLQSLREYRAGARRGRIEGGRRQAGRRREVRRLFRLFGNHRHRPVAPRAGAAARPPRRHAGRHPAPRYRSRKAEVGRAAQSRAKAASPRASASSNQGRPADKWLADTARWTWRVKSFMHLETELMGALARKGRSRRDQRIRAQPEGPAAGRAGRPARDHGPGPGPAHRRQSGGGRRHRQGGRHRRRSIRTSRRNDWDGSLHTLAQLAAKHNVSLISIGNGTASRETDKLAQDLIKQRPELKLTKIVVSEAGASVYSASEFASRELPDMDVSLRGAVSIARRLQDPLAELVKIDPKSIGVGQYQHDVIADPAGALARRGGRGLRERGRRGRQHRVGAAAGARVGPVVAAWRRASSPTAT